MAPIPEELLPLVHSRETFLAFVAALSRDWRNAEQHDAETPPSACSVGTKGWENGTIGSFLEAIHAWGTDTNASAEASWHAFAQLLNAGKRYE